MALLHRQLTQLRQPGSVLQPKPGVQDAGGNKPAPTLSTQEQTQPAITPKADYKPMADPVNEKNPSLSYEEAATQGRLQPPPQPTQGGFGGYNPSAPPPGYDPNAWAATGSVGNFTDARTGQAMSGVSYVNPDGTTAYGDASGIKTAEDFQRIAGGMNDTGRQMLLARLNPEQLAAVRGTKQGSFVSDLGLDEANAPRITPAGQQIAPGATNDIEKIVNEGQFSNQKMINAMGKGPAITPAGEKNPNMQTGGFTPGSASISVSNNAPTPPSVQGQNEEGDDSLSKIFKFFKGDLERERDQGLSDADVEAASRGVFYGTPGTTAREAVREKFGRGLGQLQADMLQNETQNQLQRLGLGVNLHGINSQNELGRLNLMGGLIPDDMNSEGVDPNLFAAISQMFGGKSSAGGVQEPAVPRISAPNVRTTSTGGAPGPAPQLKYPQITPPKQTVLTKGKR